MKPILLTLFSIWMVGNVFAYTSSTESILKQLDSVIENKYQNTLAKESEIATFKQKLHQAETSWERYKVYGDLFNAYLHFQADSSLYYINKRIDLLEREGYDKHSAEMYLNRMNRAEVMGVMGMYNEALEELDTILVNLMLMHWSITIAFVVLVMVGWPITLPVTK